MDVQTIVYLGLTCGLAFALLINAAAFGPLSLAVALLSILAIMLILVLNYADFIVFPAVTSVLKVKMVPAKGYYIPQSSNAVIKNVNGLYYATGYLTANIYNYVFVAESVDEEEEQKLGSAPDKWERIVMNAGFPFRFNIISIPKELQKYRDELEGTRGTLEYRLSKEQEGGQPSQLVIDDLTRKISIIDARINRIAAGERPVDATMYLESTAVGVSEKEAMDALSGQLAHLQTLFSSFDLSIGRVMGREVYNLFSFGYTLPSYQDLGQAFSTQK